MDLSTTFGNDFIHGEMSLHQKIREAPNGEVSLSELVQYKDEICQDVQEILTKANKDLRDHGLIGKFNVYQYEDPHNGTKSIKCEFKVDRIA